MQNTQTPVGAQSDNLTNQCSQCQTDWPAINGAACPDCGAHLIRWAVSYNARTGRFELLEGHAINDDFATLAQAIEAGSTIPGYDQSPDWAQKSDAALNWVFLFDNPDLPLARCGDWMIIPLDEPGLSFGVWRGENDDEPRATFDTLADAQTWCEAQPAPLSLRGALELALEYVRDDTGRYHHEANDLFTVLSDALNANEAQA